ncbi:MAG: ATP-dependent protease subunit HslV [Bacteroidota bacterium]|nr:ATP-dependent protease subunit HslV [Bacteroidota bacterium]MDP4233868.1 ATP-dependent protease subunit HslV [Bacteroidota bacterium]MDP4243541.1 ATP-dependent protease subunit HslV [Bacteroidota bacterium]MDP4288920.1 ATP-dependent protease subunit HslV [Bacteroidota bacterium]
MLIRSTTVLGVVKDGKAALGSDGQVTTGQTVMKSNAKKLRMLGNGTVIAGFAGSTSDALTLYDRFNKKLEEYRGNVPRAVVELGRDWRSDKYLRRLEAMLAVVSRENAFLLSGTGDVIEPENGIVAIGSGGPYALAAARAFMQSNPAMSTREIVESSLKIAGEICIYSNTNLSIESLD